MRISHEHKFIFFALPKTGSTTIRFCLDQYFNADGIAPAQGEYIKSVGESKSPYYHHGSLKNLKEEFLNNNWIWSKYFKFTFVRNPFDRIVSFYHYYRQDLGYVERPELKPESYLKLVKASQDSSFADFIKYNKIYIMPSQFEQIKGGEVFIGKSENFQEDFNTVCDKIGIPQQQLPHKNKSKHKHYTEYYDDETKEIVAKQFAEDIGRFRFEFGE